MPRNRKNTRKIYIKRLTKYRLARLLGVKPSQLTSQGSYVTKKRGRNLSKTTKGGVKHNEEIRRSNKKGR